MKVPVYLFHRVSDESDSLWPPIVPALFDKIIQTLSKKYNIISIEELFLNSPAKSSKPYACICFDDGYKDNLEIAAPILQHYKCPATFYVVTSCIDSGFPTWTYILDYNFSKTSIKKISLQGLVPSELEYGVFSSQSDKEDYARKLKPFLKTIGDRSRIQVMESLEKQMVDTVVPQSMMNWKEVNQLKSAGFIIGSHSVSHPLLAKLQEEEEIKNELFHSAQRIEQQTGIFPITISYPIGSYDQRVMKLAKDCGYKLGLAVEQRFAETKKGSLFSIPRVELYQESWLKTQLRMSGVIGQINSLMKR